jgi:hypothetical protein
MPIMVEEGDQIRAWWRPVEEGDQIRVEWRNKEEDDLISAQILLRSLQRRSRRDENDPQW